MRAIQWRCRRTDGRPMPEAYHAGEIEPGVHVIGFRERGERQWTLQTIEADLFARSFAFVDGAEAEPMAEAVLDDEPTPAIRALFGASCYLMPGYSLTLRQSVTESEHGVTVENEATMTPAIPQSLARR